METKDPDAFAITFHKAGVEGGALERAVMYGLCPVTFKLQRGKQKLEFTVYVDDTGHPAEDFIKVAQHQLHHDLVKLAEQTAQWHLDDVVISEETKRNARSDLAF